MEKLAIAAQNGEAAAQSLVAVEQALWRSNRWHPALWSSRAVLGVRSPSLAQEFGKAAGHRFSTGSGF